MAATDRRGSFRLGGVVFAWRTLPEPVGDEWVSVSPHSLDEGSGEPLPADFLAFVGGIADDEVRTLSMWSVYEAEFEWPAEAWRCGCLAQNGFAEIAQKLNGDTLVATPGPVSDRFVMRSRLIDELGLQAEASGPEEHLDVPNISFGRWAKVVGVDNSYFCPGFPSFDEPTGILRSVITTPQAGDAHEAYARAFDSYFYGGLPTRLAETAKEAFLESVEARSGFDYLEREGAGVRRRILAINSLRLRTSLCCTVLETRGAKIFASKLETVAESTRFGRTELPLGFRSKVVAD
ncbi:hypothetical protein ACEXQD_07680 [Herbiconiux sp. P15]|uniref:hypothetical protein n=1 Tax=Herbiconiux liukaitaii TaxID=3342799 RepID=UPI0035B7396F